MVFFSAGLIDRKTRQRDSFLITAHKSSYRWRSTKNTKYKTEWKDET